MADIENILVALGINSTLWIQLGIFVFVFLYLNSFVFKPYFAAYLERQNRTMGNQEKAEQIYAQTRELEALYQRKMRGLTADIKAIYDKARSEATIEQEKLYAEAREKAKMTLESARNKIESEYNKAREELMRQAPELSRTISVRLLKNEGTNEHA
jgi:F-type H+-transporting ATPase subunit b